MNSEFHLTIDIDPYLLLLKKSLGNPNLSVTNGLAMAQRAMTSCLSSITFLLIHNMAVNSTISTTDLPRPQGLMTTFIYHSKKLIMSSAMSSEINSLGHQLSLLSERNRQVPRFHLKQSDSCCTRNHCQLSGVSYLCHLRSKRRGRRSRSTLHPP